MHAFLGGVLMTVAHCMKVMKVFMKLMKVFKKQVDPRKCFYKMTTLTDGYVSISMFRRACERCEVKQGWFFCSEARALSCVTKHHGHKVFPSANLFGAYHLLKSRWGQRLFTAQYEYAAFISGRLGGYYGDEWWSLRGQEGHLLTERQRKGCLCWRQRRAWRKKWNKEKQKNREICTKKRNSVMHCSGS